MGKETKYKLFNESGCLTLDTISNLIDGKLSVEEMLLVDKHISSCKICASAVQGGKFFSNGNEYKQQIAAVKNTWSLKRAVKPALNKRAITVISGIAASLIIISGILLVIRQQKNQKAMYVKHFSDEGVELNEILTENEIIPYDANYITADSDNNIRDEYYENKIQSIESVQPVAKLKEAYILAGNNSDVSDKLAYAETDYNDENSTFISYPYIITNKPPLIKTDSRKDKFQMELTIITEMPRFEGGSSLSDFTDYVQNSINYPLGALNNNVSGKVLVQFTVNTKGEVVNPAILNRSDILLEQEVIRVITNSPKWKPGRRRNKPVDVSLVIPVNFEIQ
ncbi:MAG: energy transducer TonB [Bacteroidales bacterium]|nr:energy transducer TonB [Bacteroidales bacterium]